MTIPTPPPVRPDSAVAAADQSDRGTGPRVPAPPFAPRRPEVRELWGERVVDELGWLRTGPIDEVEAHLRAENDHTQAVLAEAADLENVLYDEIRGRIRETDLSVPVVKDSWEYYTRTLEGRSYAIHCRRPVTPGAVPVAVVPPGDGEHSDGGHGDGEHNGGEHSGGSGDGVEPPEGEEILLDENVEAGDGPFFEVGPYDVSPDHRLLLWGWDRTGDERYTATVRDLSTGRDLGDRLEDVSISSAWSLDGSTVFYVRPDAANRPHEVWRHRLGTDQCDDVLVYREDDERFFVGVGLEKDDSFIQIGIGSKITDEVWVVPADAPETEPRVIAPRRQGVEYTVAHRRDRFVILTNDGGATDFKVVTAPDDDPGPDRWQDLDLGPGGSASGGDAPTEGPITISGIDVSDEYLVLFERAGGSTRIRVRRWADGVITTLGQPEAVSTVWPGANPEFASTSLRYGYSSMVSPTSVLSVDLESGERTVLKQQEVVGGFDPTRYRTERSWATAEDGTRVPISLVARTDRPAGPGPCVLYAYGAYEVSTDPTFSSARLSLLDRGFVFAIAHVRGGGELGRAWYLGGKFEHKTNTFGDLVACAHHLIDRELTEPSQLVIRGGSAGGLAVGAALNASPGTFAAAVAQVPFVDVLNTMLDPSLPLTVTEWEEWGDPASSEEIYRAMRGYAPYENVGPAPYPSVLATAGLNDTRVGYWEAAKWVQVLRDATISGRPVLLRTDLGAGHGGPSGRYDAWREEAKILAYILWSVGHMS
jgi:oligopeptidase B